MIQRARYLVPFLALVALLGQAGVASDVASGTTSSPERHIRYAGFISNGLSPGDVVNDHGAMVQVPLPGFGVWSELDLSAKGYEELGVETKLDGTVALYGLGDEAEEGPFNLDAPSACSDNWWNNLPFKWTTSYDWYFRADSTPSEVNVDNARSALVTATLNVTSGHNDCGLTSPYAAPASSFSGDVTFGPDIGLGGGCLSPSDGVNVTSFGTLPSGVLGVTCTYYTQGNQAVESDMKLNKDVYRWYVVLGSGCNNSKYSVTGVATHERGHTFGAGHVSESAHGNLTMSTYINGPCQDSESTFGKGDLSSLDQKY